MAGICCCSYRGVFEDGRTPWWQWWFHSKREKVPDIIADSTSLTTAYQINRSDFTIHFDAGGADADFIQKVPIVFSNDNGATYKPEPTDGWSYTKTSNSITFSNPNPQPPKALIKFEVEGTEYASTGGAYVSEEALFDECLQIWECITCSGRHGGELLHPLHLGNINEWFGWKLILYQ